MKEESFACQRWVQCLSCCGHEGRCVHFKIRVLVARGVLSWGGPLTSSCSLCDGAGVWMEEGCRRPRVQAGRVPDAIGPDSLNWSPCPGRGPVPAGRGQ